MAANGSRDLPGSILGSLRKRALPAVILIAGAVSACSSMGDNNPFTVLADPGKYQYYTCEQITANRKVWAAREQELKLLMDKADQGVGGAVVNVLAYRADYVAAGSSNWITSTPSASSARASLLSTSAKARASLTRSR